MINWLIKLFKPSPQTIWDRSADSMALYGYTDIDIYDELGPRPIEKD